MCPAKSQVSLSIHAVWSVFAAQLWVAKDPKLVQMDSHYEKHAYSNTENISLLNTENCQIKNSDIFHISAQIIDCGYLLEPPQQGSSKEYPNLCF